MQIRHESILKVQMMNLKQEIYCLRNSFLTTYNFFKRRIEREREREREGRCGTVMQEIYTREIR